MRAFVLDHIGKAVDRHLKIALDQTTMELTGTVVDDGQLDAGISHRNRLDQLDQLTWRNRAHDTHAQSGLFELREIRGNSLRLMGLVIDALQIGHDHASQLGKVRIGALAVEKLAAELFFKQLDGTGQRRLGNVALLRRPGEIELLGDREKVSDLVHLHRMTLPCLRRHLRQNFFQIRTAAQESYMDRGTIDVKQPWRVEHRLYSGEPVVAEVFPVAAAKLVGDFDRGDELGLLEAELDRALEPHRRAELGLDRTPGVGEAQDSL